MRKDIRFHGIRNFNNEDFFKAHRHIIFNTAYKEQKIGF